MKIRVLDIDFDNVTMDEALDIGEKLLDEPGFKYAVTPNPEICYLARKDEGVRKAVQGASLTIPDGIGVIYGAKILGTPLKGKVPGADFAEKLMARMAKSGKTAYFLGAKPGVAEKAAEKLAEKYSGLTIVGCHDGYFKDDSEVIADINAKNPDLLLVCLGAPKQENWMADNADKLSARLAIGLGGSLDVYAGTVERAPEVWQKLNLEWLYRIGPDPKRWGRAMRLPAFIFQVIGEKLSGKAHSN
ncbi:MAG: WecB/TagA/CpsF family glycosyltransferase [Oscillospiraceae bacterium]|nr:WecB/TagA/CpsF family glycosyltransferase [Oscillospiraceae bacterium]